MIKFNRRKLLNAGAAVNLALSLLYVLAVVMMFRHVSFKLGGGEHEMSINFLPPTATRILNWSLLCLASLFVSVVLFADGFSNKLIKYAAIAIAVFLAGCELINFFAPLLRHLSRHIKKNGGTYAIQVERNLHAESLGVCDTAFCRTDFPHPRTLER